MCPMCRCPSGAQCQSHQGFITIAWYPNRLGTAQHGRKGATVYPVQLFSISCEKPGNRLCKTNHQKCTQRIAYMPNELYAYMIWVM